MKFLIRSLEPVKDRDELVRKGSLAVVQEILPPEMKAGDATRHLCYYLGGAGRG